MKKLVSLLLALVLVLGLAACGASDKPAEPAAPAAPAAPAEPAAPVEVTDDFTKLYTKPTEDVSLEVWYAVSGVTAEKFEALVNEYAAANPNVKIEMSYAGSYADAASKISANQLTGTAPDVALISGAPMYTGGRGDSTQVSRPQCCLGNGMHHNMSIGIASLRRDGFASMTTDGRGSVTTRPVIFSGRHFFVNADARFGALKVAVIDEDGKAVPGFGASDCRGLGRTDSTKAEITWKGGDLSRFAGRPVRFRFDMHVASLYSFWVAKDRNGRSNGYLGGGGSGYSCLCDR